MMLIRSFCSIFGALGGTIIASDSINPHAITLSKTLETERRILAPVDSQDHRVLVQSSQQEQNKGSRSPELSELPPKQRATPYNYPSSKENSSDSDSIRPHTPPLSKTLETERRILAPVDSQDHRVLVENSQQEQNKRARSPELSELPLKRRATPYNYPSSKENGSNSDSDQPISFFVNDDKSRVHLYAALQKNEHEIAKAIIIIMTFNKVLEPGKVEESSQTLNHLLPRLTTILAESLPIFAGYTYVDIVCNLPTWHEALMVVFFNELKTGILRSTPLVLRARHYAVKWLEKTAKQIVQELQTMLSTENPALLTPPVAFFLNPDFVPATFEYSFYEQITERIRASEVTPGSGVYELSTPPVSIFERLEHIETEKISPTKKSEPDISIRC